MSGSLRRYIYFTATITGAAIMIVEVLGAKMLSPFIGLSHFVWTAQIAVTLVALACGYYVGGRLADHSPKLNWLYWAICGAAVFLALTVLLWEPVAYWCLDFNLAVGSLLASTILFFVPLALLAMTGPFLIRVITSSVAGVGGNVGRLTSVSTLGSFVGTVLIGYVLIPFLPNSVTMYVTAVVLMILALLYFAIWGRSDHASTTMSLLLCGSVVAGLLLMPYLNRVRTPHLIELYRCNSNFGMLQVVQTKQSSARRLFYLNDFLIQNTYDPETKQSTAMFTYMLHGLARAYTPQIQEVLCIGLGVGIVPMQFANEGCSVDVVEINPAVAPVGARYFDFRPSKVNLTIVDGRYYVNKTKKKYDAIILDAFLGDSSPVHLFSREAFSSMRRVLKPGGTLVMNTFWSFEPNRDFFSASIEKTLKNVFASVRIHNGGNGNLFFVASDTPNLAIVHPPDFSQIHPSSVESVKEAFDGIRLMNPAHGRVLTDDYNPTEFYDAANREALRRTLALSVRPSWA